MGLPRVGHGLATKTPTYLLNIYIYIFVLYICCSVTQSCPILCDPMTTAHQASLSITNSQSFLKLMSIELVMPSNHLILCHPLHLPPSIFSSIRVFSSESVLCIRWPKFQLQHQFFQCIFRTDCL